jgi:hypothetical protein
MLAYFPFRLALHLLIKYSKLYDKSETGGGQLPRTNYYIKATGEKESFDISGYKSKYDWI